MTKSKRRDILGKLTKQLHTGRSKDWIHKVLRKHGFEGDLAIEDVIDEAICRAGRWLNADESRAEGLRKQGQRIAFLKTTIPHLVIDEARKRTAERERRERMRLLGTAATYEPDQLAVDPNEATRILTRIKAGVKGLTPVAQRAFEAFVTIIETGQSVETYAASLGMRPSTVKDWIYRTSKILRRQIETVFEAEAPEVLELIQESVNALRSPWRPYCVVSSVAADLEFARTLTERLREHDLPATYVIVESDPYASVRDATKECDRLIVVLSEPSIRSFELRRTFDLASIREQEERRRILASVRLLRAEKLSDILGDARAIDFRSWRIRKRFDAALLGLLATLRSAC